MVFIEEKLTQEKKKRVEPQTDQSSLLYSCLINDIIMILYKTANFNTIYNQDAYIASIAALNLASIPCPICGVVGLFIFYGTYTRKFFSDGIDSPATLSIKRIQCSSCKRTQALIPFSLVPYSRFPYILICSILDCNDQEMDKLAISYQLAYEYIQKKKQKIKSFWITKLENYDLYSHLTLLKLSISLYSLPFGCTHNCISCIFSQPT